MKRSPNPRWHRKDSLLERWSVREDEPSLGNLIAAFAVFALFLIVLYVWTIVAWAAAAPR